MHKKNDTFIGQYHQKNLKKYNIIEEVVLWHSCQD